MNEVKVTLEFPIPFICEDGSTKEITELVFKPIKAKALKKIPRDSFQEDGEANPATILPFISISSGIPLSSIEEIDFRDMNNVTNAVTNFLPKSQETGKK
jgi:hypothetical protein